MTGWVIYDKDQYQINEWFAQQLIGHCSEFCEVKLIISEELEVGIIGDAFSTTLAQKSLPLPDFAIMRTINPFLSFLLEKNGVKVFNNYLTAKFCNDKRLSYFVASMAGIDTLRTSFFSDKLNKTCELPAGLSYPVVIKSSAGHGGKEVFLVDNHSELLNAIVSIRSSDYVMQEKCPTCGKDLRVYVLNGKILCAVLRTSNSFKSNYSLGATINVYPLSDTENAIITKLLKALPFVPDFIGIDFLLHNNILFFNEMEDVVGTRMLYDAANLDAAKIYVDHIKLMMQRQ